jgi:acyl carrier protein
LREFESLYIGDAEPAMLRRSSSVLMGLIETGRAATEILMTTMARPGVGNGPIGTSTRWTMSEIGERVKKIVVEHLGVEPEKVVDNASFIDDLGADSLDTVELVMAFEEEFGCEIPDDAAETILTVGDATKFLEKNAKS